jgi:hypothetical protein
MYIAVALPVSQLTVASAEVSIVKLVSRCCSKSEREWVGFKRRTQIVNFPKELLLPRWTRRASVADTYRVSENYHKTKIKALIKVKRSFFLVLSLSRR